MSEISLVHPYNPTGGKGVGGSGHGGTGGGVTSGITTLTSQSGPSPAKHSTEYHIRNVVSGSVTTEPR